VGYLQAMFYGCTVHAYKLNLTRFVQILAPVLSSSLNTQNQETCCN